MPGMPDATFKKYDIVQVDNYVEFYVIGEQSKANPEVYFVTKLNGERLDWFHESRLKRVPATTFQSKVDKMWIEYNEIIDAGHNAGLFD